MEKHVYFVRHGETDSNAGGVFYGEKSMLTDLGREQAKTVAGRVEKIGVDALVSSTFVRALDTADAIAQRIGLPVERSDLFVEWREPSKIYGRHKDEPEIVELHGKMLDRHDNEHHRHLDEETAAELKVRATAALQFLHEHPAERICVVTHGAFLRVIFGLILLGDEFNARHFKYLFHRMTTSNTGVTHVRNTNPDHGWQLVSWNDSAHLG